MITFATTKQPPVLIPPDVMRQAHSFGVTCEQLAGFVRRAIPIRSRLGNRRHREWVFALDLSNKEALAVVGVVRLSSPSEVLYDGPESSPVASAKAPPLRVLPRPPALTPPPKTAHHAPPTTSQTRPLGPDEFVMWEEHESCEGAGCDHCDDGMIRTIRRKSSRVVS